MINVTTMISLSDFHFHWPFVASPISLLLLLLFSFNNCLAFCDVQRFSEWPAKPQSRRNWSLNLPIDSSPRRQVDSLTLACDHVVVDSIQQNKMQKYMQENTMHVFPPTHIEAVTNVGCSSSYWMHAGKLKICYMKQRNEKREKRTAKPSNREIIKITAISRRPNSLSLRLLAERSCCEIKLCFSIH